MGILKPPHMIKVLISSSLTNLNNFKNKTDIKRSPNAANEYGGNTSSTGMIRKGSAKAI